MDLTKICGLTDGKLQDIGFILSFMVSSIIKCLHLPIYKNLTEDAFNLRNYLAVYNHKMMVSHSFKNQVICGGFFHS